MFMYSFRAIVLIWLMLDWNCCTCQNEFYGTAELVKHAPRRSRLLSDFVVGERVPKSIPLSAQSPPSTSQTTSIVVDDDSSAQPIRPTIDTLKRYARIFKMDTKNLTDQQRDLLERIVERVARLGGSLEDIGDADAAEANDIVGTEGRARQRNVRKNPSKKTKVTDDNNIVTIETTQPTPTTSKSVRRTSAGIIAHKAKGGKSKVTQANELTMSNVTAVDLGNITTTSIVNILSTDNARENLFARRPSAQPPSASSPHEKIAPVANANSKVSIRKKIIKKLIFNQICERAAS